MKKIRASKCEIRDVSPIEEKAFLNGNHYQGYIPSIWCKGLYLENQLVCLMSFGRPRFNKFYSWELLRLCTLKDCTVYGGASRLFKYFLENNDIGNGCISYCNRDKFTGDVYKKLGFRSNSITKGYHYEKNGQIFNRYSMQKNSKLAGHENIQKTIESQGGIYYPEKTERENAELNGFIKVTDKVGQELFIFGDKARMYIYKITFEDGSTYIGEHIQYKDKDDYVCSSSYYKQGHTVKTREILIDDIKDRATLDFLETVCILEDKASSCKNVNGNLGNFVYNHPYNIGKPRDYKWSNETREKFRKSMVGKRPTEETIQKIAEANRGKKRTEEQRRRISEAHKGIKQSEESKLKKSETLKKAVAEGRHRCFEKGHVVSDEVRAKISETMRQKGLKPKGIQKGAKWWNNGTVSKRSVECPGADFVLGRI